MNEEYIIVRLDTIKVEKWLQDAGVENYLRICTFLILSITYSGSHINIYRILHTSRLSFISFC